MTALSSYVDAPAKDAAFVAECEATATAMVTAHLNGAVIPAAVLSLAILEVGADLYHRRSARNGVAGFDAPDSVQAPVRIARDPMRAAYDILGPYLGPRLA